MTEQGDLETLRPKGHESVRIELGEVVGMPPERVAGQGPGRLGHGSRDHRLEPAAAGLGDGRFERTERGLSVGRGDAAVFRGPVRAGTGPGRPGFRLGPGVQGQAPSGARAAAPRLRGRGDRRKRYSRPEGGGRDWPGS